MIAFLVAAILLVITVAYLCLSGNKSAIARKVKCAVSSAYIRYQKRKLGTMFHFDYDSTDVRVAGLVPSVKAWNTESPRLLGSNIHASDTVTICGVHQNGSVLVTRVTRRHERRSEAWVYLRLASGKEYVLPGMPDANVYDTDGRSFSAAGLVLEVLEPLFRWRVSFNGYLRELNTPKDSDAPNIVLVRFNFIWRPSMGYVAFPHDFSAEYMTELLANKDWLKENFIPHWTKGSEESLEQLGEMNGMLTIENEKEQRVLLRGLKSRRHGILDWSDVKKKIAIHGVTRDGTGFHLTFDDTNSGHKSFAYGYVLPPSNMDIHHITTECITDDLKAFELCASDKKQLYLNMKSAKKDFSFEFSWEIGGFNTYGGENWDSEIVVQPISVHLNGTPGEAVLEFVRPNRDSYPPIQSRSLPILQEPVVNSTNKLVVSFDEVESRSSKVVGGKGASLALMASLRPHQEFVVPDGISVTRNAFELFVDENAVIRKGIRNLIDVAWNRAEGVLSDECSRLVQLVESTRLPIKLKVELQVKLLETFGESFESFRFAVRSSAIGEDGEDTSAAGQNETYLGVRGFEEIGTSIIKCWASQFAFRSTEYKRQNGQLLDGGMGVVIQKMVPAEAAGVLFTRDPLTGSAATMIITSNYGLGESVVSASVDPDTITLKRSWNGQLTVDKRQLGTKETMIAMSDGTGTNELEVSSDRAKDCSVSDATALRLGKIALDLERRFGTARDIEWSIEDGTIYLLQSRPVTTDGNFTDYEIIHEFDSTMRTDEDVFTTANVGEVLPGSQSTITVAITRAQNCYFQKVFSWRVDRYRFDPTWQNSIIQFYGHTFMDLVQSKVWALDDEKSAMGKALDIGVYGRVLEDDNILRIAQKRFENPSEMTKLMITVTSLKGALFGTRMLKNTAKTYTNYPVATNGAVTPHDAYENLSKCIFDYLPATKTHYSVSLASMIWNLTTMNMLSNGKNDYGLDLYSDFAKLVGSAIGAESGDVPFSLQAIINAILKEIGAEEFLNMTPQAAHDWLQKNKGETGKKFQQFLVRHGHRGIKEFDYGSTSWGMDPVGVVNILQTMAKNPTSLKTSGQFSPNNAIDNITTQLTPFKKWILKWVMKGCRNGVMKREKSKALLVKFCDGMRRGYRHLGELMVKDGFIPDPKLVIFMTHEEIGRLLANRSAKIIRRAQHRRRIYAYKDKLQFPEMSTGFPIPIQEMDAPNLDGTSKVKGYPVSQGKVEALARVVPSFHDISAIQPGEILITYSTDIGWSPYFPMLAGVVTEIGGLVSHGAVVAREFGLPCLVGAQGATKVFQSGDRVLLDATGGFICKVE